VVVFIFFGEERGEREERKKRERKGKEKKKGEFSEKKKKEKYKKKKKIKRVWMCRKTPVVSKATSPTIPTTTTNGP